MKTIFEITAQARRRSDSTGVRPSPGAATRARVNAFGLSDAVPGRTFLRRETGALRRLLALGSCCGPFFLSRRLAGTTNVFLALAGLLAAFDATAASRSSANYSVPADSNDSGGRRSASASYRHDGCVGVIGGVGTVAVPAETMKHGYIGQLYEVSSLVLNATPTTVNEGATRQLNARASLDDATTLNVASSAVTWSLVSGPILSISAGGLATAASVYQNTAATVRGDWRGNTATLGLTVLNVGNDDFGTYAGDGIDDAWQVQYFGVGNPNAGPNGDPDGDGQNTRYEYTVGSIPTDGNSYFRFRIERVPGQPTRKNLIFSPRVAGRTYTPQYKLDLNVPGWDNLGGVSVLDAGPQRTVTDLNAVETNKFYRVRVTIP